MPQMKAPANRAPWPPLPKNDPAGRYPKPFPVGQHPRESFWTIADKAGVDVKDLVRYNFLTNSPGEINWYLKHYVGCINATADGQNFVFRGTPHNPREHKGVIFIPSETIEFEPAHIVVARKEAGAIRWIQLAISASPNGQPTYMIPGVSRTSSPLTSKLPAPHGQAELKMRAVGALVRYVATVSTGWLSDYSVKTRLEGLEPGLFVGGANVSDALQPNGRHEAVIVMLRRTRSKQDPGFPKLPFGKPTILGFGDIKDAYAMIDRFWQQGAIFADPGDHLEVIYEYYLGTRL